MIGSGSQGGVYLARRRVPAVEGQVEEVALKYIPSPTSEVKHQAEPIIIIMRITMYAPLNHVPASD